MPMPRGSITTKTTTAATTRQSSRRGWRRRLLTWALAAVGLGLGFLIPYTLYLNHQVGERFGQLRWQMPDPRLRAPAGAGARAWRWTRRR